MTDEFALRKDAYHLGYLFVELDQAKHTSAQHRGERVQKPAPGPRTPGNGHAIDAYAEIGAELRSWCVNMRDTVATGEPLPAKEEGLVPLARWVALKAFYIAEHPEADTLHSEVRRWIKDIEKIVGRGPDITDIARKPEAPQSTKSILIKLRRQGHDVQARNLHDWTARGHITAYPRGDGTNRYLMTEVLEYLTARGSA